MSMRRLPISDRSIRRWLERGAPRRVERRLDTDPQMEARVRALSDLDDTHLDAVKIATALPSDLIEKTRTGVQRELAQRGLLSSLGDLLGLGMRTADLLLTSSDDADTERGETDDDEVS